MHPRALRLGASVVAALVVVGGALTTSPASAAVGDDDPTVGASAANGLVVNEVESNGDDTDWVELANTSSAAIDLSGYAFLDDDSSHEAYVLPTGSTIAAGGYFVIDQLSATAPGFDFGLGGADTVRVYDRRATWCSGTRGRRTRRSRTGAARTAPVPSWTRPRRRRARRTTAPRRCASTRWSPTAAPRATGWS